ncbi:FHA domain-containing protein [Litoreibacter roseus]|uniref:FHA domain-containing protein n=1 Tax=Litoreibacter roseus TaxID=2601869 RepID=A0A6N6JEA8_9RHOB|nr:FHA domain-containing protein [Litoreibacter roseus]GFE64454.1 hypothetical protein KIN_15280 [Litoreibacter roseus]
MKFIREMIAKKSADKGGASEEDERLVLEDTLNEDVGLDPLKAAGESLFAEPQMDDLPLADLAAELSTSPEDLDAPASLDLGGVIARSDVTIQKPDEPEAAKPAMNVWDIDTAEPAAPQEADPFAGVVPEPTPEPAADASAPVPIAKPSGRPGRRAARTKTRLLGFDPTESPVVDLFDEKARQVANGRAKFPVGWIIVADGPGRGESYALLAGMSQIGRGEDQAVQLDFGDTSISRTNHAAIAYDPMDHKFHLGHGGKSNLVRLNGKPLLSTEELSNGDEIVIGETTLRLVALCGPDFNWETDKTEGDDDVAIA